MTPRESAFGPVHVLLFDAHSDQEGIHSLELNGRTVVLMFEDPDDAERYAGLLEAQDFPVPTVELIDREELEQFCRDAGYEGRFVPAGFLPSSDEERLLIAPPERNMDVSSWKEQAEAGDLEPDAAGGDRSAGGDSAAASPDPELEAFRRRLEGLL